MYTRGESYRAIKRKADADNRSPPSNNKNNNYRAAARRGGKMKTNSSF
jgi:hypothetical protein